MLKTTNSKNLTKPTTLGQTLTKKGKYIVDTINTRISYPKELNIRTFTRHENNIAYIIKNPEKSITASIKERDSAVKLGASGLIALIQKNSLELIGTGKTKIKPPEIIKETLNPGKNNIIIITFAPKKSTSELAGLAISLDLIKFNI